MAIPEMVRVDGNGVTLNAALWAGHEGPVLCIHGLTANCRCFDGIAAGLVPDYHLAALDLRGRGLSDKPEAGYAVNVHCRDILTALKGLRLERAVLLGHSLGATIALAFAAGHPECVSGVVVLDGGAKLSREQMEPVLTGLEPSLSRLGLDAPSPEAYLELMKQSPHFSPWNDVCEAYFRHELEPNEVGGVRCNIRPEHIAEEMKNLQDFDPEALYGRVGCPVLILRAVQGLNGHGGLLLPEDAVRRMQKALPQAIRVDLEGTDHYSILFQDNQARDSALRDFLRRARSLIPGHP